VRLSRKALGQIDTITAQGSVHLEELQKSRKGDGEKLIYTANDGKYVLRGTAATPPSIFDAEHGQVTGGSLTFFSHDDRVQINGIENSRLCDPYHRNESQRKTIMLTLSTDGLGQIIPRTSRGSMVWLLWSKKAKSWGCWEPNGAGQDLQPST